MRVAIVSPFDPWPPAAGEAGRAHVGGVERVLLRYAEEAAARGHEVTLLCSTAGAAGAARRGGLDVVRLPRRATVLRAPLASFARALPRDADLVHVPATYPFTTPAVLRAAERLGIPSVLDFHFEPYPPGAVGRAAAGAYRLVGPRSYRLARVVLVRSMLYGLTAPSLDGVPLDRWRAVPNGFDPSVFKPEGPSGPPSDVLVVGRLVPYKGVEVLLRAAALVEPGPRVLVAGDGPLRARLEALARRLGVDARFLGRVPDERLPELYRGARVTALPSLNGQEAFGVALVESMACGTPVVASRLPGVEEVAALGGVLARPGDPQSLAGALALALEPGRLARGPALAARAAARYAWSVTVEGLLAAYEEAVGRRLPARPGPEVAALARPRRRPLL